MALNERLAVLVEAVGGSAVVSEFNKIGSAATKAHAAAVKGGNESAVATGKLGGALEKLGITSQQALTAGVGAAATVVTAKLGEMVEHGISDFVRLTGEVRGFQRVAGGTAEESSRLVGAFHLLGIDTEAATKGFGILSKTIENTPEKLSKLGIQVARNSQGNVDLQATLFSVADAYNHTTDQAEKNTIALTAFGRGGLALLPILQRGREGIEELFKSTENAHLVFSQADLDRGRQFTVATRELHESIAGLEVSIGSALVPTLTKLATISSTVVDHLNSLHLISAGVHIAEQGLLGPLADVIGLFGNHASASQRAAQAEQAQQEQTEELTQALDEQSKALDDLLQATEAQFDTQIRFERAQNATEDAEQKVTAATKAQTDAVRLHGARSGEAAQANEDLSRAVLDARSSLLDQAAAAQANAEAQAKARGVTLSTEDATKVYRDELDRLRGTVAAGSPLRAALDSYIATLDAAPKDITTFVSITGDTAVQRQIDALMGKLAQLPSNVELKVNGRAIPGLAGGGQLDADQPAIVGEHGPELFVPSSAGRVIPHPQLATTDTDERRIGGAGDVHIHVGQITVQTHQVGPETGNQIMDAIERAARRGRKLPASAVA